MRIEEVPPSQAPLQILLEADPSAGRIEGYLGRSRCFVATIDGGPVGAYVLQETAPRVVELMSIAVAPDRQRAGIGSRLLRHAVATARELGARRVEVGTGTFGYQLAWYQRAGFRVEAVLRDFFLDNYDEPIVENGIQHRDMLRLAVVLEEPS
jgi:ribosomal protein S18 acetylase RimI-like enzyme